MMTPKQRLVTAIKGGIPDRLPVTTHHLQRYYLNKYENGMDGFEYHKKMGFDPIVWTTPIAPNKKIGQYEEPMTHVICSPEWEVEVKEEEDPNYQTFRYNIHTPGGDLTTVLQKNEYTSWIKERLLKKKEDMELVASYAPHYYCDVDAVNALTDKVGESALVRGNVACFQPYGQPGCFQDLACLYGTQELILECFDDPDWVKEAEKALQTMKITHIRSMKGAKYDILEHGGGDASTSVISPAIFDEFVAPFDAPIIDAMHEIGIPSSYHTCGNMMPILEAIADMGTDAMETFTPKTMGTDVILSEAKKRIGDRVCMIGGFDQIHYFKDCTEEETRAAVRKCFADAGADGGFILSPSDHFFEGEENLIRAFVDEAHKCVYG